MMHGIKTLKHAAVVEVLSYNDIPLWCPKKSVIEFDITKCYQVKILK